MQKLYANQLAPTLKKALAPCYLVFGEEPLQKMEALDEIRAAAKRQGFDERQSFILDGQFDWSHFFIELASLSLFAPRRLIELDLGQQKLTPSMQEQLKQLPDQLHSDLVIVLHAAKNASEWSKQGWFKRLADVGVQVQFYPLDDQQFQRWLQQRAQQLNLKLTTDALQLLLHHSAGNLLAARQSLEKLTLVYPAGSWIDLDSLQQFLTDQSHYTVFQLIDAILEGDLTQALHRLDRLLQQDVEVVMLLWHLQKEATTLWQLQQQSQVLGALSAESYKKFAIWPKRQPLYQTALLRLSLPWLHRILDELAAFDRAYKSGLIHDEAAALAQLVSLFIVKVPASFALTLRYQEL